MKTVDVISRYRLTDFDIDSLEPTENKSWLSRTQCGTIHTVSGVPSSELDILIVERTDKIPIGHVQVIELGHKEGKFGGRRHRITVRYMPHHQAPTECVAVWIDIDGATAVVHVGESEYRFGRWRSVLDSTFELSRIVRWHYSRYYRMLSEHDVSAVEAAFCDQIVSGRYTLAEANRLASRLLYRSARECGYRKLTLRQQKRLGLSGQWHTEAEFAEAQYARFHASATGCGEYTINIARRK